MRETFARYLLQKLDPIEMLLSIFLTIKARLIFRYIVHISLKLPQSRSITNIHIRGIMMFHNSVME